jgi:hypothetical protein
VVRTAADRAHDYGVHVFNFMTDAQRADARSGAGLIDMTSAIQAAIDFAMYSSECAGPMVILPEGVLKTTDTIHLGYGTTFNSVVLCGQGPRYTTSGVFAGTLIKPTFNDRPVFAVQGARGTTVRNLKIEGLNATHIESLIDNPAPANLDADTWVDPTFPASASSQFAPYCAIAIDPYGGNRPGVSYPDVNYPAFLGAVAQYNKGLSTRVWIDNVMIEGFVVGVAIQPCNTDGNGDFIKMNRCDIYRCQYAISIGNTQARLTRYESGEISRCHTGLVTQVHGTQLGKPSVSFADSSIWRCLYWLNTPNIAYGGGPHFVDCYGESMYAIGLVGSGATNEFSVCFEHCEFNFGSWLEYGTPTYIFKNMGLGFVTFEGCAFQDSGDEGRCAFFGVETLRIVACNADTLTQSAAYERFALNATAGLHFNRASTHLAEYSCRTQIRYNLDTGLTTGAGVYTTTNAGTRSVCLPVYTQVARANINDPGFFLPRPEFTLTKAALSISTLGRDVTVDLGVGHTEGRFAIRGGDVGDVIWDSETGVTFYVRSRTGTTIIMRAQTGFDVDGELLVPVTTAGTLYFLNCRRYTPVHVTYADTSSASAIATNVQRDDAFKSYLSTEVLVGDRFWVDDTVDFYQSTSASNITGVDATLGTITVAANFRRTETHTRLKLFVRAAAPNA